MMRRWFLRIPQLSNELILKNVFRSRIADGAIAAPRFEAQEPQKIGRESLQHLLLRPVGKIGHLPKLRCTIISRNSVPRRIRAIEVRRMPCAAFENQAGSRRAGDIDGFLAGCRIRMVPAAMTSRNNASCSISASEVADHPQRIAH